MLKIKIQAPDVYKMYLKEKHLEKMKENDKKNYQANTNQDFVITMLFSDKIHFTQKSLRFIESLYVLIKNSIYSCKYFLQSMS